MFFLTSHTLLIRLHTSLIIQIHMGSRLTLYIGEKSLIGKWPQLRFVDCDILSIICGPSSDHFGFGADPIMLVHLAIGTECENDDRIGFRAAL
jgi:hypothetical protein